MFAASRPARAFYTKLGHWVSEGTVLISGEDGEEWSYTYAAGGVTQSESNGWDGSAKPFGEPVDEEPPAENPKRRRFLRRR